MSYFDDFNSFLLDITNESKMADKGVSEVPIAPDQHIYNPDGACSIESSEKCVNPLC